MTIDPYTPPKATVGANEQAEPSPLKPALIGLGWALVIGILGASMMGAIGRLTFFVVIAVVAAIFVLVAKRKSRRITRIVVLLSALVGAGLSYPYAAAEADWYLEQKKGRSVPNNPQSTPPVNAESAQ